MPGSLSAEPAKPDHQPPATQQDHAPAGNNHEAANADHGHDDAGLKAARELIPPREDVPWLRPVLLGVGGLFAAAVLIGIPLSRMKPAAAQDGHQASHATGGGQGSPAVIINHFAWMGSAHASTERNQDMGMKLPLFVKNMEIGRRLRNLTGSARQRYYDDDFNWDTYTQDKYGPQQERLAQNYDMLLDERVRFDSATRKLVTGGARIIPNSHVLYEIVGLLGAKSVLEIGCGGGDHLRNLKNCTRRSPSRAAIVRKDN
ncbi:MAG: hypothetical protein HC898_05360 [Phycisphaerales bacterium]|nr:hypothetical protein [Phycisphaerales bacterium]